MRKHSFSVLRKPAKESADIEERKREFSEYYGRVFSIYVCSSFLRRCDFKLLREEWC